MSPKKDLIATRKRKKKKKCSQMTRLREARRLQRLQRLGAPTTIEESITQPCPPVVDKAAQNRVILELAWKTIALMHKNRLIQQKIIALQKETAEFVSSVMNNPENKKRYLQHVRMYGVPQRIHFQQAEEPNNNTPLKLEPDM